MNLKNDLWTIEEGVLYKCNDTSECLVIPEGVERVEDNYNVFNEPSRVWPKIRYKQVYLPKSFKEGSLSWLSCDEIICYKPYSIVNGYFKETSSIDSRKISSGYFHLNVITKTITANSSYEDIIIFRKNLYEATRKEILETLASYPNRKSVDIYIRDGLSNRYIEDIIALRNNGIAVHSTSKKDFLIIEGVLVAYYGNEEVVVIPEGVREIAVGAFKEKNISDVIFPQSLKVINDYAFWGCSLKVVAVPNGVYYIGVGAFHNKNNGEYDIEKLSVGPRCRFKVNPPFSIKELIVRCESKNEFLQFINKNLSRNSAKVIKQISTFGFHLDSETVIAVRDRNIAESIAIKSAEYGEIEKYFFSGLKENIAINGSARELVIGNYDYVLLPSVCRLVDFIYLDLSDGKKAINNLINDKKRYSCYPELCGIYIIGGNLSLFEKAALRMTFGKRVFIKELDECPERCLKGIKEEKEEKIEIPENNDDEIMGLINSILSMINDYSDDDKSLIKSKIKKIVDKYNCDLERLEPTLGFGSEITLTSEVLSPEILKNNLLNSLEMMINVLSLHQKDQKLKSKIDYYESLMQSEEVEVSQDINDISDKVCYIIARGKKKHDTNLLDELSNLFRRTKEDMYHQRVSYFCDDTIKMQLVDFGEIFPLEVDRIFTRVKKDEALEELFMDISSSALAVHLTSILSVINLLDEDNKKAYLEEYYKIVSEHYHKALEDNLDNETIIHNLCLALNSFLNKLKDVKPLQNKYMDLIKDIACTKNRNYESGHLVGELVAAIYELLENPAFSEKYRTEALERVEKILNTWPVNIENHDFDLKDSQDIFPSPKKAAISDKATRYQIAVLSALQEVKIEAEIYLGQMLSYNRVRKIDLQNFD